MFKKFKMILKNSDFKPTIFSIKNTSTAQIKKYQFNTKKL